MISSAVFTSRRYGLASSDNAPGGRQGVPHAIDGVGHELDVSTPVESTWEVAYQLNVRELGLMEINAVGPKVEDDRALGTESPLHVPRMLDPDLGLG